MIHLTREEYFPIDRLQTNQKIYIAEYITSLSPMRVSVMMWTEEAACLRNKSCILTLSVLQRQKVKEW